MDEMILNEIEDVVLESEFQTALALANSYLKAIAILESEDVTNDLDCFAIFQESGDEKDKKKKSKDDKKEEAKGGLINAIKRLFASIAAKLKKSEENNPDKVDEKKKAKLKKFGIAAAVTSAAAGAILVVKKVSKNRTDAEIQDELRKMGSSSDENASKIRKALATIEIKNGGKVYFDSIPIEPIVAEFEKIYKFLSKPGSDEEGYKILEETKKLCDYNNYKESLRQYDMESYMKQYEKGKDIIQSKIGSIVNTAQSNTSTSNYTDGTVKVLTAFNKLRDLVWNGYVLATVTVVSNAIMNLHYTDKSGNKHGVVPTPDGKKVNTVENVEKKAKPESDEA